MRRTLSFGHFPRERVKPWLTPQFRTYPASMASLASLTLREWDALVVWNVSVR